MGTKKATAKKAASRETEAKPDPTRPPMTEAKDPVDDRDLTIDAATSMLERTMLTYEDEGLDAEMCAARMGEIVRNALKMLRKERRAKAAPKYVVTNFYGPADDPSTRDHAHYSERLHTSPSDGGVATGIVVHDALVAAGAEDGDEVQILVVKTGRRPFGNRKVRFVAPHLYKREKKA